MLHVINSTVKHGEMRFYYLYHLFSGVEEDKKEGGNVLKPPPFIFAACYSSRDLSFTSFFAMSSMKLCQHVFFAIFSSFCLEINLQEKRNKSSAISD